jgi:hypothetical protein
VSRNDWVLLGATAGLAVMAIVVSAALGTWRFLFG